MKTAIIYTRVSSADQVTGTSLETQESDLRDYCAKNGYEIVAHFKDAGESAKTTNRPGFLDAVKEARSRKADAFIVWKLDRFARNAEDGLNLRGSLAKHSCELISVTEPIGNDPMGKLVTTFMFGIAQFDNEIRGQRAKRGMEEIVERGGWCWKEPAGYILERENDLPILKPDGKLSEVIAKAMRGIINGLHDKQTAVNMMVEAGIKRQKAHKIFAMPVYGGILRTILTSGDVKAAFQGIITSEEWYMLDAATKPQEMRTYYRNNQDFPLTGIVKCKECGTFLLGAFAEGRKGKKYPYYRCRSNHVNVRAELVEAEVMKILEDSARFSQLFDVLLERFSMEVREQMKSVEAEKDELLAKSELIGKKIIKLTDLLAEDKVPANIYQASVAAMNLERVKIQRELENLKNPADYTPLLIKFIKSFEEVAALYRRLSTENKKKLLKMLFGSFSLNPENKSVEPQKGSLYQGILQYSDELSRMAPPRGVEPLLPG